MARGDWWKYGIIYHIYPRSFADGNGDGVGDLTGIIDRLDYLMHETRECLGIDAIWISPFYRSPMVDFGYDVSGYCDVDPVFGALDDFDRLLAEARARGIRVIVDLVPNHTSDQHPWFLQSRSSIDSPKRDWYVWADPKPDGSPPNNWLSSFERVGPAWSLDEKSGQYYLHSFLPQQPDLNWWNPEVREAMNGIMQFWLDRGVDGFRIDAVHRMGHDPKLRDNPRSGSGAGNIRYDMDRPEVHNLLRSFRRTLDGYDDRMAVGEVYLLDPARVVRYYGSDADELHLAFNFSFLHQPWKAEAFRASVGLFESLLPEHAWPVYTLSNLDHSRTASRYDEGGNGQARARVAAMMLLTLRGTPFLYYGEEIGMTNGAIPLDRVVDIDGRDPERTPMQWDATTGAGFTTGEPWLPVASGHERCNVAAQRDDPASMLSLYRRLICYRKGSGALCRGDYRPIPDVPDGVFAYLRQDANNRLLLALNFTSEPVKFNAVGLPGWGERELSTAAERECGRVCLTPVALSGDEGTIIRL